jgi:hypothetical protein
MVVLFNVKSHCEICPEVEKEFKAISASYKERNMYSKPAASETPVFFAIVYYEQSTQKIFNRVFSAIILIVLNKISTNHYGKSSKN